MRVDLTTDAAEFRAVGFPFLESDPVLYSALLTTVEDRINNLGRDNEPAVYAVVRDDGGVVVGAAVCTVSYGVLLGGVTTEGARAVARALVPVLDAVRGVDAQKAAALAFAETWAAAKGVGVEKVDSNRLHRMGDFRPATAAGTPRVATSADLELVHEWYCATRLEFREPLPDNNSWAVSRVGAGRVFLWENDGRPVSMVGRQVPMFGVTRVGPVYTPKSERGHGYASALTSYVSEQFLADGGQTCLFTDLTNPTSNKIYAAIGYEPVTDFDCYDFVVPTG